MIDFNNSGFQKFNRGARGSALIAIIAAILIFSVLAASLIPMISSSGRQAAISALSDRAYLLAESGYRLVESRYRNAGPSEADRNLAVENLDGETFTLDGDEGEFGLRIYSYFYPVTISAPVNHTEIVTNPPGRLPLDNDQDGDMVQIGNGAMLSIAGNLYPITGAPGPLTQEGNVTFPVNPLPEDIPAGTMAYPAAYALSAEQTLTTGSNLGYQGGAQGYLFPLRNGRVIVDNRIILDYLYNDRDNGQFQGVSEPGVAGMNHTITANAPIVLTNYTRVHALGIAGGAEREVTYYNALPLSASAMPPQREEDTFDDTDSVPDNFTAADPDTTAIDIGSPEGNQALRITQAEYNRRALIKLNSSMTEKILDFYHRSSGGYLSYDAQVKVGFYDNISPFPAVTFLSDLIPKSIYVAAGLSFRLNSVNSNLLFNGYGISFVRGTNATLDGIPNGIVPSEQNYQPIIVLWYQTIDSSNNISRQWLAYKKLVSVIYPENNNFDAVINDWSRSGLWNVQSGSGRYNSESFKYDGTSGGILTSPVTIINCPVAATLCDEGPQIVLQFWALGPNQIVRIKLNDGSIAAITPTFAGSHDGWDSYVADLSTLVHSGDSVRIEFEVSSGNDIDWLIDDVQVRYQWPVHNSTLAVRLQEATMVKFTSGGTEPFEVGDRIYSQNSGVVGTIISAPLVNDPSWSSGTAMGTILLNNLSSSTPFVTGERIISIGHSNRGAAVDSYNSYTDAKTNIIKAYYASQVGFPPYNSDQGNNDPTDATALAYPRRNTGETLRWPVGEGIPWNPGQDYFRIIQWDAINENPTSLENPVEGLTDFAIRHYNSNLQSQPFIAGPIVELGLHAYGSGATNIYFDDFGFQLVLPPRQFFATPLQQ